MIPVLLILIPLLTGLLSFVVKHQSKNIAWVSSLATLTVVLYGLAINTCNCNNNFTAEWLPSLGASFTVNLNGLGYMLCLLTAFTFPLLFLGTSSRNIGKGGNYYALMLLSQAGLMGVFVAYDGLLFYFFWELALIPVYFLCSIWGGAKRIEATFKFFIYTFLGSLFMLIALIYISQKASSFALADLYNVTLTAHEQYWLFACIFAAFAVKMPIFPFHTWQPLAYEQAPTSVTIVLSAVMVKMGLLGIIRWLIPILPQATSVASNAIIIFSIIGIVYASLLAMQQQSIKRIVAYSSIAHMGLMCAALFTRTELGVQGVLLQMFFHGINILGLWLVVDIIEQKTGITQLNQLGGLAKRMPSLAIFMVVITLANIALPLTNSFAAEFLMFTALFQYSMWAAATAGIGIVLSAVYSLNMVQKIFYGNTSTATATVTDINSNEKAALAIITLFILVMGVYNTPLVELTKTAVAGVLAK